MILLIPVVFLVLGLLLMVFDVIFLEKKSVGDALFTMQFLLPKKPLGLIGNLIMIVSAAVLVYLSVI